MATEYLMGIHEFNARSDDEITVKKGDRIQVIETDQEYGDGWYIGKNLRTQATGLFPKVFTTELLVENGGDIANGTKSSNRNSNITSPSINGPSVHDTISDIDEAISELQNRGIDSITSNNSTSTPNGLPNLDNIQNWTPYDIKEYFIYRGYEAEVCNKFVLHKITGSILLELDLAYLKEIDITSFGTRFEISKDIKYLNSLVNAQLTGEREGIAAAQAAIRRSSKTRYSASESNHKGLMLPPQISPKKNNENNNSSNNNNNNNQIHTSPIGPRSSSLRSSLNNEESYSLGKKSMESHIIRQPSFNKNWTHPIKSNMNDPTTPDLNGNNGLFTHNNTNILLSPDSLDEYNETTANSAKQAPTTPKNIIQSRRRSYTIDGLTNSRFDLAPMTNGTSTTKELNSPNGEANHLRNKSNDTLRNSHYHRHMRSSSSLQLNDNRTDDISISANEARKSHRRHSSIMSFLTTQNIASTLASPLSPAPNGFKDKDDVGFESESGVSVASNGISSTARKYLDLFPGRNSSSSAVPTTSTTKRVGTDPLQSSSSLNEEQSPSPSSPKRSATFTKPKLRSSSSQHNLKKVTKQKTSAFMEGIRQINAEEAAKTSSVSGWMHKRGGVGVGTWKSRYFTLHGTRLSYFTSYNDSKERGLIDITAHRVLPARENEDKLISLYAASVGAGRHCFKLVPPAPGFKKGVTFTAPKVHYFAVETKEEMRAWMAALMKATIDRDETVPVISSCATPTVPLPKAQELFAEARAREEDLRARMIAGGLSNNSSSTNDTYPTTPDSPTGSSLQSSRTASSTNSSSLKLSSPNSFNPTTNSFNDYQPSDIRHLTTKTAGLQIVTNLEES